MVQVRSVKVNGEPRNSGEARRTRREGRLSLAITKTGQGPHSFTFLEQEHLEDPTHCVFYHTRNPQYGSLEFYGLAQGGQTQNSRENERPTTDESSF